MPQNAPETGNSREDNDGDYDCR